MSNPELHLPKIPKPTTRFPKWPPPNWPLPIPPGRIPEIPIPLPKRPIPLPTGGHWAAWTGAAIAVAGVAAAVWAAHRRKQRKWAGEIAADAGFSLAQGG